MYGKMLYIIKINDFFRLFLSMVLFMVLANMRVCNSLKIKNNKCSFTIEWE